MSSYVQLSDTELAEKLARTGDMHLFEILYDRFASKIYFKCLSILKSRQEAQDACHDIFLKAYLRIKSFDGRAQIGSWLYAISYNHCIDVLRKRKKWVLDDLEALADTELADESADHAILKLKVRELRHVLEALPSVETAILLMKYQDDMSIQEMAKHLKIGESAVKMRLKRARDHAATLYQKRLNKIL
jgi:RNA polymerase sigma-70 factor (ECF subfamily)